MTFSKLRSDSGAAAVEFAMILPIVAIMACAVVDYGQAVNLGTELNSAARAGAQYAINHMDDSAGILWAVNNASRSTVTASATTTVKEGGTRSFYCTCSNSDPSLDNQITCNSPECPTAGDVKKFFVAVGATATYTPILPYPGLPSSIPMTGTAIVQVQ